MSDFVVVDSSGCDLKSTRSKRFVQAVYIAAAFALLSSPPVSGVACALTGSRGVGWVSTCVVMMAVAYYILCR